MHIIYFIEWNDMAYDCYVKYHFVLVSTVVLLGWCKLVPLPWLLLNIRVWCFPAKTALWKGQLLTGCFQIVYFTKFTLFLSSSNLNFSHHAKWTTSPSLLNLDGHLCDSLQTVGCYSPSAKIILCTRSKQRGCKISK